MPIVSEKIAEYTYDTYNGRFIVLEGINGCGKGTQADMLSEFLIKREYSVLQTEEPWRKGLGLVIKKTIDKDHNYKNPRYDALLFTADRIRHMDEEILPALEAGKTVICDRFYHSTLAYQTTDGLDIDWLKSLNDNIMIPDLTLIIDVPADVAVERLRKRDRIEVARFEEYDFLVALRETYLGLVDYLRDENVQVIDGSKSITKTYDSIISKVEEIL